MENMKFQNAYIFENAKKKNTNKEVLFLNSTS